MSDSSLLSPLLSSFIPQYYEEEVEPEVLDVVCRVCEDCWASDRLEEHNELCMVLQVVSGGTPMSQPLL